MSVDSIADEVLGQIRQDGTYRQMRRFEGAQGPRMCVDGESVLLFAGSNYLDLAHHEEVSEAAARAARDQGCAAGGSRLINGNLAEHEALEDELAAFFGREAALVFNTGYMANVGLIPALVGKGDVILSDALNHASIIDGARLSRAEVQVFPHGDLNVLEDRLRVVSQSRRRVLLALDGIYSMDGDLAPIVSAAKLADRYGAILLLDDAHGTGTLGDTGRGSAEHCGVPDESVPILMGTLGKAIGSFGAFVVGSHALRDLLINTARSFIFSCALPPPQVAASRAALRVLTQEPWRRHRLQANAQLLRDRLHAHGLSSAPSSTHIVPVVLGDNQTTMAVCHALLKRGFYAQGIRHPSVPKGTARLRITPMATHTEEEITAMAENVAKLVAAYPPSTLPASAHEEP